MKAVYSHFLVVEVTLTDSTDSRGAFRAGSLFAGSGASRVCSPPLWRSVTD